MSATDAALGAAIRRLRRERGLTIEALAFAAAIHPTYLSKIERGRCSPSWRVVRSLARVLEVSMSRIDHDAAVEEQFAARVGALRAELERQPSGALRIAS